jgi:hypothetical protein
VARVDVPATIAALQRANVNTYAYMIFGDANAAGADSDDMTRAQWEVLPSFLAAAQAAGIDVWVYLVPPSESYGGDRSIPVPQRRSTYAPFYWDYVRWATEIAELAVQYPNLRAIAIDDFAGNTAEWGSQYIFRFTVPYVNSMRNAAKAIAPWITVHPVLYYTQFYNNAAISSYYRQVVDGYIFPYNDMIGPYGANTIYTERADAMTRLTASMTKCHGGNGCLQLGFPVSTPSTAGWYGSVNQTVSVRPSSTYSLSFWTNDDFIGGHTAGYHFLQVLVDGRLAWEKDVSNYSGWTRYTVNLTSLLQGKTSATLTLRLYEKRGVSNFHVSAWFDDLVATGFTVQNPGFESSLDPWTRLESRAVFDQSWVRNLSFLLMPYASRLSSDPAGHITTAGYVRTVTQLGLNLTRQGLADGTMVYVLNLTGRPNGLGDPLAINEVAELYASFP